MKNWEKLDGAVTSLSIRWTSSPVEYSRPSACQFPHLAVYSEPRPGGNPGLSTTQGETMRTVHDILRTKGTTVWSVAPDTTVHDALRLMAEKNIGAVLVLDEGGCVVGLLSERDYARKVALEGRTAQDTLVRDIMSERVMGVRPEQTVEQCMAVMTDRRIRHLPVVDDDGLVGVISIGDVVKAVLTHQEFMIEQLENYITGTPYRPQ